MLRRSVCNGSACSIWWKKLAVEELLAKRFLDGYLTRGTGIRGCTGSLSQVQTSIINPSGSWKKSCSTIIPPSSIIRLVYLRPFPFNVASTNKRSSHCTHEEKLNYSNTTSLKTNSPEHSQGQCVLITTSFTNNTTSPTDSSQNSNNGTFLSGEIMCITIFFERLSAMHKIVPEKIYDHLEG